MTRPSTFILLTLLWLPFGMLLVTAARGIPLLIEPQAWLGLIFLAPFGLPLGLACRALWRRGHVVSAWATFVVLAPATVWAVLIGGLLGPLGIAIYAIVFSLPAWMVYGIFRYRSKNRSA